MDVSRILSYDEADRLSRLKPKKREFDETTSRARSGIREVFGEAKRAGEELQRLQAWATLAEFLAEGKRDIKKLVPTINVLLERLRGIVGVDHSSSFAITEIQNRLKKVLENG